MTRDPVETDHFQFIPIWLSLAELRQLEEVKAGERDWPDWAHTMIERAKRERPRTYEEMRAEEQAAAESSGQGEFI